eukprot:CAMPEP_0177268726 /NCGR_PEP_ID=MMETSP0367-20130122/63967_1 /TAXON_ID=447022 ORGANISM="Scrippsiella hangoei-like, Strain SHHI-4" /NCGR_SAMPLE_ID=MMETSP0367 /ASSEMBLY_ACC=CAM_ASM_000362 /LENGTH=330 /DNA_ID=CAMNT_0018724373 /DNA_START=8 /DNA_END=997 /DNA_ORIENTATION=+
MTTFCGMMAIRAPSATVATGMVLTAPAIQATSIHLPLEQTRAAVGSPRLQVRQELRQTTLRPSATTATTTKRSADRWSPAVASTALASSQTLLRRDELASMPVTVNSGSGSGDVRRVLCYGDSLTAGFASSGTFFEPYGRAMAEGLAAVGVQCEVSICGLSGKTAREMVATAETSLVDIVGNRGKGLARAIDEDGPFDLVLIMAGTNDMGLGYQDSYVLQDLKVLHRVCHDRGVPTVALAPPPAPCGGSGREVQRRRFLYSLRATLLRTPGTVAVVDPADLVAAACSQLWEPDGLHFSPQGSRQFGHGLAELVAERLATPSPGGGSVASA